MSKNTLLLVFILLLTSFVSDAQIPTKWRGPHGNGIYDETGLLKEWPASGPEIIWHFDDLGEGFSSPVFANDMIYITGGKDNEGYVIVLDKNGKLLWEESYGKEFFESYPGVRSSPTVVGNLLYIYSGYGVLTCMDAKDGSLKWRKDMLNDFDGRNIQWGVTETVVVDGDRVFVTPGGKRNNVVALNRFNGDVIWSSEGKGELSAYCTPLVVELPARKLLVTHTADHLIGLDAADGKLLWSYPHTNRWAVHPNTPIYEAGGIFCFSGYGQGGEKLELSADGSSVKEVWKSEKLDSRIGGMVMVDGYLYGSGDNAREWRCVDWKTGEEKYASKDLTKGTLIYADEMLYCYSERGELALVKTTPEKFDVISQTKVELGSAQHWAHPVINDGKLYVRHGNVLIAYKIK
ncbi:PQQ-binding-like beta-propeller repeat protein [Maribellus maritimus]|uniref:PQQ-binding-like beta-propeller repeat protein n=1 Tax=Maribellus maritimus TaxID=2870838 RepID=UPI001EECE1AF|nr:PQQ-binding-like beta-propeller repeat protein [Maribellus maritimus]MCG6185792.1 PQQ-like beta-propeller repeat protein [Maribellus maritimus]